ncbi:hypothetical protein FIBSPDRAFT_449248 [Athelia psychrophila]|uniref:Uncharacterized protein n=1 Tax=Athelia psychrophila TaxID=1759441 RepID=A0A167UE38_9AGAM|nr:hypothetical protein FIBSPDRAFT_449248 [Fibularhizoctonia sp. CBS 109695]
MYLRNDFQSTLIITHRLSRSAVVALANRSNISFQEVARHTGTVFVYTKVLLSEQSEPGTHKPRYAGRWSRRLVYIYIWITIQILISRFGISCLNSAFSAFSAWTM